MLSIFPRGARLLWVAALVAAALTVGCGGDDGGGSATSTAAEVETTGSTGQGAGTDTTAKAKPSQGKADEGDGEAADQAGELSPSQVPIRKGGDNSIQTFGEEAGSEDRAAISAALHGYLDARAAGAWAKACSYMSDAFVELISRFGQVAGKKLGCPKMLERLSSAVPAEVLRDAAKVRVASVRVEGERGFAIFKGADRLWYTMPMGRDDGDWRVGALAPTNLP